MNISAPLHQDGIILCTCIHMYVYNNLCVCEDKKITTMGMPITRNQQLDKFVRAKELVFVSPYSHAMSTFVRNSLGLILWSVISLPHQI